MKSYFKNIEKYSVRRLVNQYIIDKSHLFTFDPDHAMIAFPIAFLKIIMNELKAASLRGISLDDAEYVASQFFDANGPIPEFRKLILS